MSDPAHPAAGAAGAFPNPAQLDQLVAAAIDAAHGRFCDTRDGGSANVAAMFRAMARGAVDAVAQHVRAAAAGAELDQRIALALLGEASAPSAVLVHRIDGDADHVIRGASRRVELGPEDTIIARVGATGEISDVRPARGAL